MANRERLRIVGKKVFFLTLVCFVVAFAFLMFFTRFATTGHENVPNDSLLLVQEDYVGVGIAFSVYPYVDGGKMKVALEIVSVACDGPAHKAGLGYDTMKRSLDSTQFITAVNGESISRKTFEETETAFLVAIPQRAGETVELTVITVVGERFLLLEKNTKTVKVTTQTISAGTLFSSAVRRECVH